MTNEEHIEQLKKLRSFHNGSYGRSINKAIQALEQEPCKDCDYSEIMEWEQDAKTGKAKPIYWCERHKEPCEDAVSRQTVKEKIIKYGFHAPDMTVTEFVEDLPPVTPTRPKGHWIMNRQFERRTCDNCNKEYRWSFYPHNYCPNCGADMR